MPKQKRWDEKRKLDIARNHLDIAQDEIIKVAIPFRGVHDDWFEAFATLLKSIETCKEFLQDLRDKI